MLLHIGLVDNPIVQIDSHRIANKRHSDERNDGQGCDIDADEPGLTTRPICSSIQSWPLATPAWPEVPEKGIDRGVGLSGAGPEWITEIQRAARSVASIPPASAWRNAKPSFAAGHSRSSGYEAFATSAATEDLARIMQRAGGSRGCVGLFG